MINMLQVILFILKAIGILLVSVLGIVVVLLLAFLCIPIRYSFQAEKYEDISVRLKLGWFLRILYFRMNYEKEKFSYQCRIFGFLIQDSNKPKKEKQKRKRKKRKKQKKRKQESNEQVVDSSESSETAKKRLIEIKEQREAVQGENLEKGQKEPIETKKIQEPKRPSQSKLPFFTKIKNKITSIIEGVKAIPKNIKNFILILCHKRDLLKVFFQDKKNQEGIRKIWVSIKKLLKHILPKKLIANVRFGTGDPCFTGQLLAVISLVYPLYGKSIKIIPDFLESVIEGNVFIKGRIRLGTLLIITIKLIWNKNFKYLYKNFNKLKEEL